MISEVKRIFDEALVQKFKDHPEIKKFLIEHPRKKRCLDNLCAEIIRMEGRRLIFDAAEYKQVITTVAGMFSQQAIKFAEQDSLSSIEKIRRHTEANILEDAKGLMSEIEKTSTRSSN